MPGLLPVVAWEFLRECDVIFVPRARSSKQSIARRCLPPHQIPEERFREIEFTVESDRTLLAGHYSRLAEKVAEEVLAGKRVAYLTIGDPLTYSTYVYTSTPYEGGSPDYRIEPIPV
jgi:precorrin-2/cobalt-factor-2 C20-methyltransferase